MSSYLQFINFDKIYKKTLTDKILLNEMDFFSIEKREVLNSFIMCNHATDNLSLIPSCKCGQTKGEFYVGALCSKCGTSVVNSTDSGLNYLVWLRQPVGLEKFISPIWIMLLMDRYKITKPNIYILEYLLDHTFDIDRRQQKNNLHLVEKLEHLLATNNIKRGYNSFVKNFFTIIQLLEENFVKKSDFDMLDVVHLNKDNIFSTYLPMLDGRIFPMDSTELGKYIDSSAGGVINVVRKLTGIDNGSTNEKGENILSNSKCLAKQKRVARSLMDLASFYSKYFTDNIFHKTGLIRNHITSTRSHFTSRAVIVSIPGKHKHDEIHICWSVACTLLRPYILNKLYKRGYIYRDAVKFLMFHIRQYHPVLDEIFHELLAESGDGILQLLCRNPSLHRGSIQRVRTVVIKTDPNDTTMAMSDRIGPGFNSDHDGDELNTHLPTTQKVINAIDKLEPYHNVLDLSGPNELSGNIKFSKTVIATLSNWIAK